MKKKLIASISIILLICAAAFTMNRLHKDSPALSDIIDSQRDSEIEEMLDSMTLEEKVGQMFMGCFYNGTPSAETASQYGLGSVLLFYGSFRDSDIESLRAALDEIDEACSITPLIAVDEEGGTVVRVSASPAFRSEPFKSPRELFASGGMEAVIADAHEKNALLREIGIDLNLAPVCDISTDPGDFMYSRSLGQPADVTAVYASEITKACLEDGIGCSLKHFPGYGNAADTHKGMAVDNRSLQQLEESDLVPFRAGIKAGTPSVLVSHNIVSALDDDLPASLSPAVHRMLRYDMRFDGVIITDDLSMGAISDFLPGVDSAVAAVMAGNDMLCTGNYKEQSAAIIAAVKNGEISEERIDASVRRILTWKRSLSLL